ELDPRELARGLLVLAEPSTARSHEERALAADILPLDLPYAAWASRWIAATPKHGNKAADFEGTDTLQNQMG
ncbi:MAG: hypothetical protein ACXWCN_13275, partial [Caldimonas sp.]